MAYYYAYYRFACLCYFCSNVTFCRQDWADVETRENHLSFFSQYEFEDICKTIKMSKFVRKFEYLLKLKLTEKVLNRFPKGITKKVNRIYYFIFWKLSFIYAQTRQWYPLPNVPDENQYLNLKWPTKYIEISPSTFSLRTLDWYCSKGWSPSEKIKNLLCKSHLKQAVQKMFWELWRSSRKKAKILIFTVH